MLKKISFTKSFILSGAFLAIILFVSGCKDAKKNDVTGAHKFQISRDERMWMEKFFCEIMLEEDCIYTLWGTKPMTQITLFHFTDEEMQASIDQMTEEELANAHHRITPYDLPANWENWEKVASKYPTPKFLFFSKPREAGSHSQNIYFVNILQAALVIQENYAIFRQYMKSDFSSLEVIFDIRINESPFWNEVFHNSALLGILFGYGVQNSFCFKWKYGLEPNENMKLQEFQHTLHGRFVENSNDYSVPTINHFILPIFASFTAEGKDEVVEQYKREREEIKKNYKGKDFLDLTLERLTSD